MRLLIPYINNSLTGFSFYSMANTVGINITSIIRFKFSASVFILLFAFSWGIMITETWLAPTVHHSAHHSASHHNSSLNLLLMILAMMIPMIADHLLHIAQSLNPRHRLPAMLFFLTFYTGFWVVSLSLIQHLASITIEADWLSSTFWDSIGIVGFISAWYWGAHPINKSIKQQCGKLGVVHVFGLKVYQSVIRYSWRVWRLCMFECGLVMLSMVLISQHHLSLMAIFTLILVFDRYLVMTKHKSISWCWLFIAGGLSIQLFFYNITT